MGGAKIKMDKSFAWEFGFLVADSESHVADFSSVQLVCLQKGAAAWAALYCALVYFELFFFLKKR